MRRLLIIAPEAISKRLAAELSRFGFVSAVSRPDEGPGHVSADAALINVEDSLVEETCRRLRAEHRLPVVALLRLSSLNDKLTSLPCEDFVLEPYDAAEINARLKRLFTARDLVEARQAAGQGLVIDTAEATVYLDGMPLELTFREYELLRYLAEHPGRVFSRDALLNAVWGYDFFGGDRTVDVHVRRLRSKIEDAEHSYIDTVRNMGYRFKKGPQP